MQKLNRLKDAATDFFEGRPEAIVGTSALLLEPMEKKVKGTRSFGKQVMKP